MNNGSYVSYIINSDYYKNLSNAIILINEISKDINELKLVLNDAVGDIIVEMTNDLQSLETKLEEYKTNAKSIQGDLKANAILFDSVYDLWKSKVGEVVDEGYYIDTAGGDSFVKYTTTDHPVGPAVKTSSVDALPSVPKQETFRAWSYKYKTKISKVYIASGSNTIMVEYTDYFSCYTTNVMLINVYIRCSDIFQEKNRDVTKDFNKLSGIAEIDFSTKLPKNINNTFLNSFPK